MAKYFIKKWLFLFLGAVITSLISLAVVWFFIEVVLSWITDSLFHFQVEVSTLAGYILGAINGTFLGGIAGYICYTEGDEGMEEEEGKFYGLIATGVFSGTFLILLLIVICVYPVANGLVGSMIVAGTAWWFCRSFFLELDIFFPYSGPSLSSNNGGNTPSSCSPPANALHKEEDKKRTDREFHFVEVRVSCRVQNRYETMGSKYVDLDCTATYYFKNGYGQERTKSTCFVHTCYENSVDSGYENDCLEHAKQLHYMMSPDSSW